MRDLVSSSYIIRLQKKGEEKYEREKRKSEERAKGRVQRAMTSAAASSSSSSSLSLRFINTPNPFFSPTPNFPLFTHFSTRRPPLNSTLVISLPFLHFSALIFVLVVLVDVDWFVFEYL